MTDQPAPLTREEVVEIVRKEVEKALLSAIRRAGLNPFEDNYAREKREQIMRDYMRRKFEPRYLLQGENDDR